MVKVVSEMRSNILLKPAERTGKVHMLSCTIALFQVTQEVWKAI